MLLAHSQVGRTHSYAIVAQLLPLPLQNESSTSGAASVGQHRQLPRDSLSRVNLPGLHLVMASSSIQLSECLPFYSIGNLSVIYFEVMYWYSTSEAFYYVIAIIEVLQTGLERLKARKLLGFLELVTAIYNILKYNTILLSCRYLCSFVAWEVKKTHQI